MAWWITDEEWDRLTLARQTRPPPLNAFHGFMTAIALAVSASGFIYGSYEGSSTAYIIATIAVIVGLVPPAREAERDRKWREQFEARRVSKGREVARLHTEAGPRLRYQRMRDKPSWEWLTVVAGGRLDVEMQPSAPPIGVPEFDAVLGFRGTQTQRALLGPALHTQAARWHADAGFIIKDDQAKVKLGADGYDDRAAVQAICTAFGELVDRLVAPPLEGLSHLSRDMTHPFDAARALAALSLEWPDEAEAVCAAIAAEPIGPALSRVARTGEGLLDPALDWPTRSAIGRGVLGVRGAASATLATWLQTQVPTNDASAMAHVELCEAAIALLNRSALKPAAAVALGYVIDHGGPECLAWMQARARYDKAARAGLRALSGRLEDRHVGLLTLDAQAQIGALSEIRAGELSVIDETPPA